jgi:PleD family two-component response regulator
MKGLLDMSRKDMSRKGFETSFVSGCPLRVLMVDDAAADAELALSLLQKHGYDVRAEVVRTSEEFAASLG